MTCTASQPRRAVNSAIASFGVSGAYSCTVILISSRDSSASESVFYTFSVIPFLPIWYSASSPFASERRAARCFVVINV